MSKHLAAIIIGVILFASVQAQVTAVVTSNKDKIYIGEPFTLKFELKAISASSAIQWKLPDSIPHFEVVAYDTSDILTKKLTLTSFDSGLWAVDQIEVIVPSNVNDKPQLLKFPAKVILIEYDTTGNQLLNDIKPIVEVNAGQWWIGVIVAAAALISLIVLIVLFKKWKEKKQAVVTDESPNTAFDDCMRILEKLKLAQWTTQLDQKNNFSELSLAVKRYYERKTRQPFTKLTTDELVPELKPYLLNDTVIAVAQVLRLGDAVKFARFTAPANECITALETIAATVKQSEKELKNNA